MRTAKLGWFALGALSLSLVGCLVGETGFSNPNSAAAERTAIVAEGPDVWQNSLGMVFRSVPGQSAKMAIWETRIMDFASFVNETGYEASDGAWMYINDQWVQNTYSWKNPGHEVTAQHPVSAVSWHDAVAFCDWLTRRERERGLIDPRHRYRLPTEKEWTDALGFAGSYVESHLDARLRRSLVIGNFHWLLDLDPFPFTAPVGSFIPNPNGFHDLAGNVWEYCLDRAGDETRVIRGGAWLNRSDVYSSATARGRSRETIRSALYGFRVVLDREPTRLSSEAADGQHRDG